MPNPEAVVTSSSPRIAAQASQLAQHRRPALLPCRGRRRLPEAAAPRRSPAALALPRAAQLPPLLSLNPLFPSSLSLIALAARSPQCRGLRGRLPHWRRRCRAPCYASFSSTFPSLLPPCCLSRRKLDDCSTTPPVLPCPCVILLPICSFLSLCLPLLFSLSLVDHGKGKRQGRDRDGNPRLSAWPRRSNQWEQPTPSRGTHKATSPVPISTFLSVDTIHVNHRGKGS